MGGNRKNTIEYILISLFVISSIIVFYFAILKKKICFQDMKFLLQLFISVLATVSAIIFTIPISFNDLKEIIIYPKKDKDLLIGYLFLFILGISVSTFILIGIINLTTTSFSICLLIFLLCISWMLPYLFMILNRSTSDVMDKIRDSILSDLFPSMIFRRVIRRDEIERNIGEIKRLCFISLDTHNQIALESGIENFKIIADRLIENRQIEDRHSNIFVKDIIRSWHEIGIRCLELHKFELSIVIVKNIGENIYKGVQKERDFQYHDMIDYLVDLALEAIKLDSERIVRMIITSLGQIGIECKNKELRYLQKEIIINGLQKIGNDCKKRGMKNLHKMATNAINDLKGYKHHSTKKNRKNL